MDRTRAWFQAYNEMMALRKEIARLSGEMMRLRAEREAD